MAFTISNNSPSPGYISWSGLHIQFAGETFAIANGNTDKVYAYWRPGYPSNLVVSDAFPTLTANDCLVFLNKGGIAVVVPTSTVLDGDLIVPGTVLANALAANSVTADKIAAGAVVAGTIAANAVGAEAIAAGAIVGEHIHGETITGDKLVMETITADKLAAGAVTAEKIEALAVTSAKVDVAELFASDAVVPILETYDVRNDSRLTLTVGTKKKTVLSVQEGEMVFGDPSSPLKTVQSGSRFSVRQGGQDVSYFSDEKLWIRDAEVDNSLRFGNYYVMPASDGGVKFVKA